MKRKQKEAIVTENKRNLKRHKASNRFFLDQDSMGEARWQEAIHYSIAKREGKKIEGVKHHVWQCPCACISTISNPQSTAVLVKQPKSQRKPKNNSDGRTCIHFNGKSTK